MHPCLLVSKEKERREIDDDDGSQDTLSRDTRDFFRTTASGELDVPETV